MCTVFLDRGEYCERCADAVQSEDFVSKQSDSLNRPEPKSLHTEPDLPPTATEKRHDQDRVYIWLGIGGSAAMLFASMAIYAFPNLFEDPAVLAAQAEEQRLEDCRLVFEEITYMLRAGSTPPESMTCEGSAGPNLIRRIGDVVRVEHPNPGVYGLSEMYVTNESHQVFMVEGAAS